MTPEQREDILGEFHKTPSEFMAFLTKENLLNGDIRKILSDDILNNPDAPPGFDWLPYMPNILSLVSVDGRCNLSCRMCGGSRGKLRHLREENIRTILSHIPTAELVVLVAGNSEPLLNPDLKGILLALAEKMTNVSIVTNGHLLDESLRVLMTCLPVHVDLNISLDAVTPEIYRDIRGASNAKVLENLRRLAEVRRSAPQSKFLLSLLMVGMEDNISDLPKMVELAAEVGAYRIKVDNMNGDFKPGNFTLNPRWEEHVTEALRLAGEKRVLIKLPPNAEHLQSRQDEPERAATPIQCPGQTCAASPAPPAEAPRHPDFRCGAFSTVHIDIGGSIHPCCHVMSVNLGNIYQAPLAENAAYINARKMNALGKIHRACAGVPNCACAHQLRSSGMPASDDVFID